MHRPSDDLAIGDRWRRGAPAGQPAPLANHPIADRQFTLRMPPYHWWRTVFFLIPAISIYTIVLGAASILSSLFDRRGYFAHRCARAWSSLILKTTGVRVRVEGLERITPGTTYVFVSNHQSIYDTPIVFASLPYQLRIIAKASLARFPVLGWHLRRGGHLFVDRRHPDRAGILARWRALVSEGLSLIIYAEGTRSGDGHVARFKAGSFLLAIEAGLPIVPLAIIGTRAVMPKGRLRTEPADVTLVVHDPIYPPALAAPSPRDAKALADSVHAVVSAAVEARQFAGLSDAHAR
ncbi:MAG TPA: lysophospholipid acyltransferase family protein [Vicinamibacterales bacterium]|jgi:1-acyl-sn-glycerol-3-phosphate acyltransferase|nr:lysophospholipid acyltransferase family protein [Vicinamibacterales bacterium]